jgi:DNA-3-methyladenine glycosylase I
MKKRCSWCEGGDENYIRYHDEEWGVPTFNDRKLFEFMVLESAQAGLSWRTILNRRKGYKKAFSNFDPKKVAQMTQKDVERLMLDEGIIRNRAKITATINNAKRFLEVQKEFGSFSDYAWNWVGGKPVQNKFKKGTTLPATTDLAVTMSKDLKKRGFGFLVPTVWYAHMQATGMVNDHTVDCFRHTQLAKLKNVKVGTTRKR